MSNMSTCSVPTWFLRIKQIIRMRLNEGHLYPEQIDPPAANCRLLQTQNDCRNFPNWKMLMNSIIPKTAIKIQGYSSNFCYSSDTALCTWTSNSHCIPFKKFLPKIVHCGANQPKNLLFKTSSWEKEIQQFPVGNSPSRAPKQQNYLSQDQALSTLEHSQK